MARFCDPSEDTLLRPVLRLYPRKDYRRFVEVPFACKKIDILCIPRANGLPQVCIELKIKNWKVALWQASLNLQVAHESYVAIWHQYVHRVPRDLLMHYAVGLIVVHETKATIATPCVRRDTIHRMGSLAQVCATSECVSV